MSAADALMAVFGFRRARPTDCPSTQAVRREREEAFRETTAKLLAETGKDLPAVKRLVGAQ